MTTMEVKSGCACPLCGKEMKLTGGGFYYEGNFGVVEVRCHDCNVSITEYGFQHGLEDGEAYSYFKLVNILKERIKRNDRNYGTQEI